MAEGDTSLSGTTGPALLLSLLLLWNTFIQTELPPNFSGFWESREVRGS